MDANSTFTLDFAEAYSAEPMKVNYRFNSMPVMEYAMTIQQSYVQSTTLSGETNYAVYGIPITVESVGNGFSDADRLYFVEYQNDCAVDGAAYTMCYHYGSYAANVRMYPEFSVVVKSSPRDSIFL